ncbi:MAG: hydrogenase expression/formation protein HypE [Candidatus Hydrogenedentes bacterium]|nr:hydrogenase expression/formation protein HypE [Candidatus Hydrogenedentota bacterium]
MNPGEFGSTGISWSCPIGSTASGKITLAHGGGGTLMHKLIKDVFEKHFSNPYLRQHHDSTVIDLGKVRVAFTTDSFVVKPIFFPGGDIGKLAVCGTLNDLAVAGACPLYLSAGFILEEGLGVDVLEKIVCSMRREADLAGVSIVTGDTKVIEQKAEDGLYINTSGIGIIKFEVPPSPKNICRGDRIIINGDIGRHGIAVLSARENITFEPVIESDCMNLAPAILSLYEAGVEVHCLRDCTRGGLATSLNELAEESQLSFIIEEYSVPIKDEVRGACEILGLNPLYVANEGRFVAFVPEEDVSNALDILKDLYPDFTPAEIGRVIDKQNSPVILRNYVGIDTSLPMLSGEQLPRIC